MSSCQHHDKIKVNGPGSSSKHKNNGEPKLTRDTGSTRAPSARVPSSTGVRITGVSDPKGGGGE